MKQLTFQSEKLQVDYLTFSFLKFKPDPHNKLVQFLCELGFNVSTEHENYKYCIVEKQENESDAVFSNYRGSTRLAFSGVNADHFYKKIMQQSISWELFDDAKLTRLDLCFDQPVDNIEYTTIQAYFISCQKHLDFKNKYYSFEINRTGKILKIGSRSGHHCLRIYQLFDQHKLRFEYELKGRALRNAQVLLVEANIEKFEDQFARQFLTRFFTTIALNSCLVDWLVDATRRNCTKRLVFPTVVKIDYLEKELKHFDDYIQKVSFIKLLQFLTFIQHLEYEIDLLGPTRYRKFNFPVQQFITYYNPNRPTNHYQLIWTLTFFETLQTNTLIQTFSESYYKSLVAIPQVFLTKSNKSWFVEVWVVDELFTHSHPFILPDLVKDQNITKYQVLVLFEILHVFCRNENLEKSFDVPQFLKRQHKTNSTRKKSMALHFITYLRSFQQLNLIEDYVQIVHKGCPTLIHLEQLTIDNIRTQFKVYEKLQVLHPFY